MTTLTSLTKSSPAQRVCRYSDCVNTLDDYSNVCPHHEAEDPECSSICGAKHDENLSDDKCKCWITCNKCREFCGLKPLSDADFPTTVNEVA